MNLNKSSGDEHKNTPQSFQSPFGDYDQQGRGQGHNVYSIPPQHVHGGNGGPAAPKTAPKGCAIGCLAVIVLFILLIIGSVIGGSNGVDSIDSENDSNTSTQSAEKADTEPAKSPSKSEIDAAVDEIFVASIREVDPIDSLTDEQIVSVGKKVCERLDNGETVLDIVVDATKLPKPLADDTARVAGGAVVYYCPEHKEATQAYVDAVS